MDNGFDLLPPIQMAKKAIEIGIKKAKMPFSDTLVLSILAGAFVAMGAAFSITSTAGLPPDFPYGVAKLIAGFTFCLGLALIVMGGAELFTGNSLIIMAFMSKKISFGKVLKNWSLVYFGNFLGAMVMVGFMFASSWYTFGQGQIGLTLLKTAQFKLSHNFLEYLVLGILCNVFVCLAIWLTYSARTVLDKIAAFFFPLVGFVVLGFEHSIANMFFVPIALLIKDFAPASFWVSISSSPDKFASITWKGLFVDNLIPVTIGNIIGGAVMVGAIYWLVYGRKCNLD